MLLRVVEIAIRVAQIGVQLRIRHAVQPLRVRPVVWIDVAVAEIRVFRCPAARRGVIPALHAARVLRQDAVQLQILLMQVVPLRLRPRRVPVLRVLQHLLPNRVRLRPHIVLRRVPIRPSPLRAVIIHIVELLHVPFHFRCRARRRRASAPICPAGIAGLIADALRRIMCGLHPCLVAACLRLIILVGVILHRRLLLAVQAFPILCTDCHLRLLSA